ncbi:glycoside hydrolase family 108 protein [Kaarinaea lacus]
MSNIDEMLDTILKHEGGFVNDPDDPGGATNFGVTLATLSQWLGRTATVDEVRDMDVETAKEIYRKRYYSDPGIDDFPQAIQPLVFDCAVNHGPAQAIKFVQKVSNDAGLGSLEVDGVNGPRTRDAVNQAFASMGNNMINAIVDERIAFYHRIVERKPSSEKFLKGWLRRAESFRV